MINENEHDIFFLDVQPDLSLRAGVKGSDLTVEGKNSEIESTTGFSMQVLIDFQKVLCCLQFVDLEQQDKPITNTHRVHFKEAAGSFDYSSRVTLALRQSSAWKCRGQLFHFYIRQRDYILYNNIYIYIIYIIYHITSQYL